MKALEPVYTDPHEAPQEPPNGHRSGPDTTLGETVRQPTPIRPPRPSLRDSVRDRMEDRPTGDEPGRVPADPNRGLFPAMEASDRGRRSPDRRDVERELVDLIGNALRRDQEFGTYLRRRGIAIDDVVALVGGRR